MQQYNPWLAKRQRDRLQRRHPGLSRALLVFSIFWSIVVLALILANA
jgi:hypothetical protein